MVQDIMYGEVKVKQGYRRVYMELLDVYSEYCSSKLENQMLKSLLVDTTKMFTLKISNKTLGSRFKVSEITVKKFMKKMRDAELIRGRAGNYIVNPYMFIPYNTPSYVIVNAQIEWNQ